MTGNESIFGINKDLNCHNYCRYDRCCTAEGSKGNDPWICATAWRIEDIMAEEYPDEPEIEEEDYYE